MCRSTGVDTSMPSRLSILLFRCTVFCPSPQSTAWFAICQSSQYVWTRPSTSCVRNASYFPSIPTRSSSHLYSSAFEFRSSAPTSSREFHAVYTRLQLCRGRLELLRNRYRLFVLRYHCPLFFVDFNDLEATDLLEEEQESDSAQDDKWKTDSHTHTNAIIPLSFRARLRVIRESRRCRRRRWQAQCNVPRLDTKLPRNHNTLRTILCLTTLSRCATAPLLRRASPIARRGLTNVICTRLRIISNFEFRASLPLTPVSHTGKHPLQS